MRAAKRRRFLHFWLGMSPIKLRGLRLSYGEFQEISPHLDRAKNDKSRRFNSRATIQVFFEPEPQILGLGKPGIRMVYPNPCKGIERRPRLFLAGTVPHKPSSTGVLIVAHPIRKVGSSGLDVGFDVRPKLPKKASSRSGLDVHVLWCLRKGKGRGLLEAVLSSSRHKCNSESLPPKSCANRSAKNSGRALAFALLTAPLHSP